VLGGKTCQFVHHRSCVNYSGTDSVGSQQLPQLWNRDKEMVNDFVVTINFPMSIKTGSFFNK
jgi:hypothetical protein